jgi:hypothetical protein
MLLLCCRNTGKKVSLEHSIEASLAHILSTDTLLPKEYYANPLQIIGPANLPVRSDIVVNDKKCILLPAETEPLSLLQRMDVFPPIPLVEISKYRRDSDSIYTVVILRAVGKIYYITMNGNDESGYQVTSINQDEI